MILQRQLVRSDYVIVFNLNLFCIFNFLLDRSGKLMRKFFFGKSAIYIPIQYLHYCSCDAAAELKVTEGKMVTLTDIFDPALFLLVGGPWEAPLKRPHYASLCRNLVISEVCEKLSLTIQSATHH